MLLDSAARNLARTMPGPVRDWIVGHRETDLPPVRIDPGLVAKWWVDEYLLQTEIAMGRMRMPTTDFRRRLRDELDDALDLFAARGWIADPRAYHLDPPIPTAGEIERTERHHRGIAYERLRYPSHYEPHADEPGRDRWLGYHRNATAHAYVLRHPGPARPWIVCQNGYRTGFPATDFPTFAVERLHHRLGLNVAVAVAPLHGPRREGASGDRVLFSGAMNMVHLGAQAAWDLRRLLAWIREDQAAPAVGTWGISLGGYIVSLVAALDGDQSCVIAGVPEPDLVRGMRRNVEGMLPPFYEQWGLSWSALERVTSVASPLAMAPLVAHDRRYVFAGLVDRWVRPGNVRSLIDHWEDPHVCWYAGSHLSFAREPEVRRFVAEALSRLTSDADALGSRAASQ
jgi:hypothetical protein